MMARYAVGEVQRKLKLAEHLAKLNEKWDYPFPKVWEELFNAGWEARNDEVRELWDEIARLQEEVATLHPLGDDPIDDDREPIQPGDYRYYEPRE